MSRAKWGLVFASITLASTPGAGLAEEPAEERGALGPEVLHNPTLERTAEQGILRAVPIAIEIPVEIALRARRVLVHYRLWGDPDWTALELRRSGAKYEGAIPCLEISTVTGDLRYYIRVHDAEGNDWLPAGQVVVRRSYTFNETEVLAREAQEQRLLREMTQDVVAQLVRRLQAAHKPA